jgi:carboxylesterase type B
MVTLAPMARAADTVKIDSGVLEGTVGTDPSVRVFRGLPFAAPPVGDAALQPKRLSASAVLTLTSPGCFWSCRESGFTASG